jgi:hypothetical protein
MTDAKPWDEGADFYDAKDEDTHTAYVRGRSALAACGWVRP